MERERVQRKRGDKGAREGSKEHARGKEMV